MTPDERAELRELQRRAYGRDGVLTDADIARLRALEHDRAAEAVIVPRRKPEPEHEPESLGESAELPDVFPPQGGRREPEQEQEREPDPEPAATSADDDREQRTVPWRTALRGRGVSLVVASMLLLVLGLGAGWALFAPRHDEIPLSDAEIQRRAELESQGEYDPGSVRPIGRDDDALVWFASKSEPDRVCLVLDVDKYSQSQCVVPEDDGTYSISVAVSVPRPAKTEDVVDDESIAAYAMPAVSGEPLVAIQRWTMSQTYLSQFEGDERTRADALQDEGFALPSLSIAGYFRDEPVWVAERTNESGEGTEQCLIVDAVDQTTCSDQQTAVAEGLVSESDDPENDPWTMTLRIKGWSTPYLTITETAVVTKVLVGSESGDPIEVTTPLTDPDG